MYQDVLKFNIIFTTGDPIKVALHLLLDLKNKFGVRMGIPGFTES